MYPRQFFDTFWRPDLRNEVFVAMSFAPEFTAIWESILRPAIEDTGLKPRRVDTTVISGNIVTEIMDGIAHARVVLGELTCLPSGFPNGNVMYEIGLAHSLRQAEEVLLVRSEPQIIPITTCTNGRTWVKQF